MKGKKKVRTKEKIIFFIGLHWTLILPGVLGSVKAKSRQQEVILPPATLIPVFLFSCNIAMVGLGLGSSQMSHSPHICFRSLDLPGQNHSLQVNL